VAGLYDEARPSYPHALVDDVLAFAAVRPPGPILEVGAGTGKATVLFAARGYDVLGIEPSPEMAALARRNCAQYRGVQIEETDFERWPVKAGGFGLAISAQAWHWVAPEVGYAKALAALRTGGALAAFWNYPSWEECELREEIAAAYARAGYVQVPGDPMDPAGDSGSTFSDRHADLSAAEGFTAAEHRTYRWNAQYTRSEYLSLLQTHSPYILLSDPSRRALLAQVGAAIDAGGGSLTLPLLTGLDMARAGG